MKFVTIILFFTNSLLAQTYINRIDSVVGGRPGAAILIDDSLIVVASTSILNYAEIHYSKYDFKGNLLLSKTYEDTSVYAAERCKGCLSKHAGRFYMASVNFFLGNNNIEVVFQKLDNNLDTIQTSTYVGFVNGAPFINSMDFDSDSTFIATGYVYGPTTRDKYDLWVARFDTAFNVLWEKRFTDKQPTLNGGYFAEGICIDAYGSVLVSGRAHAIDLGTRVYIYYSVAARLNRETGDLLWLKEFNGPTGSREMFALDEGDGTYRFAQEQWLKLYPGTYTPTHTQIRLGLLDTLGNVIWDTLTGPKQGLFEYHDFQRTADGNLYMAGARRMAPTYISAGYKFSPKGDSIWFRDYFHPDSSDISYIWSFQETADSGFVHTGIFIDRNHSFDSLRLQYSWLFKTDKYGCVVQNCHTIGIPELKPNTYGISVYPNPNQGVFTVNLPQQIFTKGLKAEVYNLIGKQLYSVAIENTSTTIKLKTPKPGFYTLRLVSKSKIVHVQKLLIK